MNRRAEVFLRVENDLLKEQTLRYENAFKKSHNLMDWIHIYANSIATKDNVWDSV